jgi:hypothetical protein
MARTTGIKPVPALRQRAVLSPHPVPIISNSLSKNSQTGSRPGEKAPALADEICTANRSEVSLDLSLDLFVKGQSRNQVVRRLE